MSRRVARRAQSKLQGEVKESRRVSATNRRQETPGQVKSRSKAAGRALEQRITFESVGGSNKKAERKKKMGEEGKSREMKKSREGDDGGDEGREVREKRTAVACLPDCTYLVPASGSCPAWDHWGCSSASAVVLD
jgi:hypothetical protein